MIRRTIIAALLALTGCGWPDYLPECSAGTTIAPERYATLSANFALYRSLLAQRGILPDAEFCATFVEVSIVVRDEPGTFTWAGGQVWGVYRPDLKNVILAREQSALAHELTHHLDERRFGAEHSKTHTDWDSLGYTAVQATYVQEQTP